MASEPTRGAQVRLDGDARQLARGEVNSTIYQNIWAKRMLEEIGETAAGNTVDGSTKFGTPALDEVLLPNGQFSGLAGALTRPLNDRLRDQANALDWNGLNGVPLKQDGINDDTAGLRQFFADISAQKLHGYARQGTFLVSDAIPILSGTRFSGAGFGTVFNAAPNMPGSIFTSTLQTDLDLRDFKITGNKAQQVPGNRQRGMRIERCNDVFLDGVWVDGVADHGIFFLDETGQYEPETFSRRSVIMRCRATNCGVAGAVGGTGILASIDSVVAFCYAGYNRLNGFKSPGSRSLHIGCLAEYSWYGGGFETGFIDVSRPGNVYAFCTARWNFTDGFRFGQAARAIDLVNCRAEFNGSSGVVLLQDPARIRFIGGYYRNNGQSLNRDNRANPDGLDGVSTYSNSLGNPSLVTFSGTDLYDDQTDVLERDGTANDLRATTQLTRDWATPTDTPMTPKPVAPGDTIKLRTRAANTGPVTFDINGTGPLPVLDGGGLPLVADALVADQIAVMTLAVGGTHWTLTSNNGTAVATPTQEYGIYNSQALDRLRVQDDCNVDGNKIGPWRWSSEATRVSIAPGVSTWGGDFNDPATYTLEGIAAETVLVGSTLKPDEVPIGTTLRFVASGILTGATGSKQIRFYAANVGLLAVNVTSTVGPWELEVTMKRVTSTSWWFATKGVVWANGTAGTNLRSSTTINLASTTPFSWSVRGTVAAAGDSITQYLARLAPAA